MSLSICGAASSGRNDLSSVGKAKEHADWKRRQEDERSKGKITPKLITDSELKDMILALLMKAPMREKELISALRLSHIQSFRLPNLVDELEQSGRVKIVTEGGERAISIARTD